MNNQNKQNGVLSIAVMGDGGAGKTAATIQWVANHFVEYYDPTIEDSYRKTVVLENKSGEALTQNVEVLDTAGQQEFSPLRDSWIRSSDAFLLIYSITSRASLLELREIVRQIKRTKDYDDASDRLVMHMVGNKLDLDHLREVSTQEAEALARELGISKVSEISAKTRDGLTGAWDALIRDAVGPIGSESTRKKKQRRKAAQACTIL